MILLIDNYDSFVHNLARYFERLGVETLVVRNDQMTAADVRRLVPDAIILSPGPCTPDETGYSLEIVNECFKTIPLLGVCLGHQVIAQALGGRIVRGNQPCHGRASRLTHSGGGVFAGLPASFDVGRYHSLVVDPDWLPAELESTAWTDDRTLMAFVHREWPVVGLQFHPESILTEFGYRMLANFLDMAGVASEDPANLFAREYQSESKHVQLPNRPVTF
ncbi:MAG: anthranilate synthase component II [Aeoliella sp.]